MPDGISNMPSYVWFLSQNTDVETDISETSRALSIRVAEQSMYNQTDKACRAAAATRQKEQT